MGMHADCGHSIIMATSMAQLHMQAMTVTLCEIAELQMRMRAAAAGPPGSACIVRVVGECTAAAASGGAPDGTGAGGGGGMPVQCANLASKQVRSWFSFHICSLTVWW